MLWRGWICYKRMDEMQMVTMSRRESPRTVKVKGEKRPRENATTKEHRKEKNARNLISYKSVIPLDRHQVVFMLSSEGLASSVNINVHFHGRGRFTRTRSDESTPVYEPRLRHERSSHLRLRWWFPYGTKQRAST
jgi:hypothetical protein